MTYIQSTGNLYTSEGRFIFSGYSGAGVGKNNHQMQEVHNVGPIPLGWYDITERLKDGGHMGPNALKLEPRASNKMFGRSGFFMHGDSMAAPGTASQGCLIFPPAVRSLIWAGGDHAIEVREKI